LPDTEFWFIQGLAYTEFWIIQGLAYTEFWILYQANPE
jgi:hypothetical protein